MIALLFKLLCAHALGDFAWQSDTMAKLKNWNNKPTTLPPGQKYVACWHYWMSAHCLIHGGLVYLVTGRLWLGLLETGLHFGIDCLKCAGKTNPNTDQLLHVLCKLGYCL